MRNANYTAPDRLAAKVRMMMVSRVVMMMVMVVTAGKCRNRYHDEGKEQEWQKLFHAPDYIYEDKRHDLV
jgi:hypothetical protein